MKLTKRALAPWIVERGVRYGNNRHQQARLKVVAKRHRRAADKQTVSREIEKEICANSYC